ncbi:MAG: hypothetical protein Q4E53_01990 [Eubacteriales bacterium]|nr:hypothetical protein [Eubacteriales bacterium]
MTDFIPANEEEIEVDTFEMEYADGTKAEVMIVCRFEIEFEETDAVQEYVAVTEIMDEDVAADEVEIMIYRYYQDPLHMDSFHIADIEDEEEREIVQGVFEEIMSDDSDEEE